MSANREVIQLCFRLKYQNLYRVVHCHRRSPYKLPILIFVHTGYYFLCIHLIQVVLITEDEGLGIELPMNLVLIGIEYIYLKTYTIPGPVAKNATLETCKLEINQGPVVRSLDSLCGG